MRQSTRHKIGWILVGLVVTAFFGFPLWEAATTGEITRRSGRVYDWRGEPFSFWRHVLGSAFGVLVGGAMIAAGLFFDWIESGWWRYIRSRELPLDNARRASLDPEA